MHLRKQSAPASRVFHFPFGLPADAEAEHKLQLLLDKSVAVVAAFSTDPQLCDDACGSNGCEPSTSGRRHSSSTGMVLHQGT